MDIDKIKQIIEVLKGTDITEIQLEKEDEKIVIKRGQQTSSPVYVQHFESEVKSKIEQKIDEDKSLYSVNSPIVGTVYRAASPDASYFVEAGSKVKKGTILCIIEAMKLMNEIESEVDGTILKVLVENGQAVEYGQPLFLIELQ
jgi:acetyl-CoA carboxylase biotin carboxyl carrier protein